MEVVKKRADTITGRLSAPADYLKKGVTDSLCVTSIGKQSCPILSEAVRYESRGGQGAVCRCASAGGIFSSEENDMDPGEGVVVGPAHMEGSAIEQAKSRNLGAGLKAKALFSGISPV